MYGFHAVRTGAAALISTRRLHAGREQRSGRSAPAGSCRTVASGPGWRSRPSAARASHPSTPSPASGDAARTTDTFISWLARALRNPFQCAVAPDIDRQALHVHGEHSDCVLAACRRMIGGPTSSKERAPPSLPTRISSSQPQCRSTCATKYGSYQYRPWLTCNIPAPSVLMEVS